MKHCPQCEFTFDDQQEFCDFDGAELLVVPERPPSFSNIKLEPSFSQTLFRRLIRSRGALTMLALGGVLLSALVIGYYDSVSQASVDAATQTRIDSASVTSPEVNKPAQVETQSERPRTISTQRRIGADELPSSMTKRLRANSKAQSAKSERFSSNSKLASSKRSPIKAKTVASKRNFQKRPIQAQAKHQSDARLRNRRQQRVASVRAHRQHLSKFETRNSKSEIRTSSHRKDPKVVAILKKTGSILKRPFEFMADR